MQLDEAKTSYSFLNRLSESKRMDFVSLPENKKRQISEKVKRENLKSESEIVKLWEGEKTLHWLQSMPKKYTHTWTSLNEAQRNSIATQAEMYNFKTQDDVDHFWETRNFKNSNKSVNEGSKVLDRYFGEPKVAEQIVENTYTPDVNAFLGEMSRFRR